MLAISPTAVTEEAQTPSAATFALFQNYPNPFNPSTAIRFSVPRQSMVTISMYNVLGQKVATLVGEVVAPGMRTVTWEAAGMPAGVYFCRLVAGSHSQTRKLLLLK